MGPDGIVMPPPALDHDLSFLQRVEDLTVQQFVAQAGVEALDVPVLPGTARSDVGGLSTDRGNSFLHGLRDELRAVVRPDVPGHSTQNEEIG